MLHNREHLVTCFSKLYIYMSETNENHNEPSVDNIKTFTATFKNYSLIGERSVNKHVR